MLKKITKIFKKNKAEGLALISGQMPKFVYGIKHFKDIPVFCFHSAHYPLFEKQLQFLHANKFNTLNADELYERSIDKKYVNNGKDIALTFDDGMASVWTVAYPLLQKYEQKIISFILPGLIVEGEVVGNTIDDVADEQGRIELASRDYGENPLCNWQEIKAMHNSGLIDFQSHGMYHAMISTSNRIIDFIHPDFDVHYYGNTHVPVYDDGTSNLVRHAILGHPVYEHSPRLSALPRYQDAINIRVKCEQYVNEHGGDAFFKQLDWRDKITKYAKHLVSNESVVYESAEQVEQALKEEIINSKKIIDSKLNKEVKHFCYPWFVGSSKSAQVLQETGYVSAHVGATIGFHCTQESNNLLFIKRVQEEYFMALPGKGSHSLLKVFANKRQR